MQRILFFLFLYLASLRLTAGDSDTLVVTTTPQMHCQNCEDKIKRNLRFEKGVRKIETDVARQTVTIVYRPDKTTPERLLRGFPKFGYTARILKKGETVAKAADEVCTNM